MTKYSSRSAAISALPDTRQTPPTFPGDRDEVERRLLAPRRREYDGKLQVGNEPRPRGRRDAGPTTSARPTSTAGGTPALRTSARPTSTAGGTPHDSSHLRRARRGRPI